MNYISLKYQVAMKWEVENFSLCERLNSFIGFFFTFSKIFGPQKVWLTQKIFKTIL